MNSHCLSSNFAYPLINEVTSEDPYIALGDLTDFASFLAVVVHLP
jgi:hypothetical protein